MQTFKYTILTTQSCKGCPAGRSIQFVEKVLQPPLERAVRVLQIAQEFQKLQ
jgi:hypothetical protein